MNRKGCGRNRSRLYTRV